MVKYSIKNLDEVRYFCREHFKDICSYSRYDIIPQGHNFTKWFNAEVYASLRDNSFFPIFIQDTFAGFCILDFKMNEFFEMETKTAVLKVIYVAKEFRGSIKILKFLLQLKNYLVERKYKRLLCETSDLNTNVKRLIRAFSGKRIFGTYEINM